MNGAIVTIVAIVARRLGPSRSHAAPLPDASRVRAQERKRKRPFSLFCWRTTATVWVADRLTIATEETKGPMNGRGGR